MDSIPEDHRFDSENLSFINNNNNVTTTNNNNTATTSAAASGPSRYENQKRRDWNTFGQYLRNHRPPLAPRPRVPPIPRPVRQDQGPRAAVPLLREPEPASPMPVPTPPGLGKPRRPHRSPPCCLRRARRRWPRDQPLRRPRRQAVPPRGPGLAVQGPRDKLREEEAEAATATTAIYYSFPSTTRYKRIKFMN